MAFKPVSGNAIDIKKTKGEPHVGTFTGKSDIVTKIGPQVIWEFMDEDGEKFGVYGFTNHKRCMSGIKIGAMVRITYQGTKNMMTKFGLKDVHQALVEVDDEYEASERVASKDVPF